MSINTTLQEVLEDGWDPQKYEQFMTNEIGKLALPNLHQGLSISHTVAACLGEAYGFQLGFHGGCPQTTGLTTFAKKT
jgi:hypothetical protein